MREVLMAHEWELHARKLAMRKCVGWAQGSDGRGTESAVRQGRRLPPRRHTRTTANPAQHPPPQAPHPPAPPPLPPKTHRGIADFEHYISIHDKDVGFDALTRLYDDPADLAVIEDLKLRRMARALVESVRPLVGLEGRVGFPWQAGAGLRQPAGCGRGAMSVATPTLLSRSRQAVDRRYQDLYWQCTLLAKELASMNMVGGGVRAFVGGAFRWVGA